MVQTGKNGAAISMKRSDSNRQPEERYEGMKDEPVDLDEHRGMAAQIATDIRRQRLHEFQVDQAALRRRQEELEKLLLAAPAETWPEAATKAQYLRLCHINFAAENLGGTDLRSGGGTRGFPGIE